MTISHLPDESDDPLRSRHRTLPTMYDLPSEHPDDPSRDEFHVRQSWLLRETFQLPNYPPDNYFVGSNLYLYFDLNHIHWYKIPDWFLALDVPRLYNQCSLRNSYVIWQELRSPSLVIEIRLPASEAEDLGRFYAGVLEDQDLEGVSSPIRASEVTDDPTQEQLPNKLEVYEKYLHVPHYFVYDRDRPLLRYFHLINGQYHEQKTNAPHDGFWLADLEIGLGIWQGRFQHAPACWLRWCDRQGNWLLTEAEQIRGSMY